MTQAVTLAGLGSTTPTIVSPTLTSPVLGTPVSGSLVNCTDVNYTGFKNRIINGGMVIDQRNAGASVAVPVNGVFTYSTDRWACYNSSNTSKFTFQQTPSATETGYATRTAAGFNNYLAITSSSAYTLSAGDLFFIDQPIEGFNIADLAWGTASAKTITLSFLVYSSLTGTFGGALQNSAANRSYPFTYSIPVANTWTTISLTIAGETTGTWLTTSGVGVRVIFGLGMGTTYSGTAGSWAAAQYWSATGAVSVVGTSGATFYITGVQLEKGSVATSFDQRAYSQELAMCQRYYESCTYNTDTSIVLVVVYTGSVGPVGVSTYSVQKRATPTITFSSTARVVVPGAVNSSSALAGTAFSGNCNYRIYCTSATPTAGAGWIDGFITYLSAEL